MIVSKDITGRQAAVLGFIKQKISSTGRPPTIREIGRHFGFRSTGTTRDHVAALARKGYLRLNPRQSRSIELSRPLAFRIPLMGRIVAGLPDLAWEETEGFVQLDDFLPRQDREIFALKVTGDSMKDKGILEGDIAIIKKQKTADAGDIVAALIESEATVKILKKKDARIYLAPANPAYPEIHKPFVIIGKVTAVLKRF